MTRFDIDSFLDDMETAGMKVKVKPFDKREVKDRKKSFSRTERTVKGVAKDTNKTRRVRVKPTKGSIE